LYQTTKRVINSVARLIALFDNTHDPKAADACAGAGEMAATIADS
jgi:predicted RNA methylase